MILVVLAFVAVAFAARPVEVKRVQAAGTKRTLSAGVRAAGLRFAPEVAPQDRARIIGAIAAARPEARRLIDVVDGLVTVRVGAVDESAVGLTAQTADGFDVTLDLGLVLQLSGDRGIARLVLHELGHVVDFAIVPDALDQSLDAQIPRGYGCAEGQPTSACAPRAERFAESFAKWATGDLGFNLALGYKVMPPDSVEAWGADLVRGTSGV